MEFSAEMIANLREAIRQREGGRPGAADVTVHTDDVGIFAKRRGTLVEWLREAEGGPAEAFALAVAAGLVEQDGGALVVVDRERTFFPPAAFALGIEPAAIVVIRPRDDREALWAFDQALRCPAVSAVWGRMESLPGKAYRRLQLSAEEGGAIGFLSRSIRTRSQAAWCEASYVVRPLARACYALPGRTSARRRSRIATIASQCQPANTLGKRS